MVVVVGGDASAKDATLKYSEVIIVKSAEVGRKAEEPDDVAWTTLDGKSYYI